jgi:Tol biopolymer transport system component
MKKLRGLTVTVLCLLAGLASAAEPAALTTDHGDKEALTVSWDGRKLAYRVDRAGVLGDDIATLDLKSGESKLLTGSCEKPAYAEGDWAPTFTLDNQQVVFAQGTELWLAPLDGTPRQWTKGQEVRGFKVIPKVGVVFASQRPMSPTDLEGKAPDGVAGFVITKLYRVDTRKEVGTLWTKDMVGDTDRLVSTPDGGLITISHYPSAEGGFDDRTLALLDQKGKRSRIALASPFLFQPAFFAKGRSFAVVDQVFDEALDEFTYPVVTWDLKKGVQGKVDIAVPKGSMITNLWTSPDQQSLLLTMGREGRGFDVYRYAFKDKTLVRLTSNNFADIREGKVSPTEDRLYFIAGRKGQKGNEIYVLDLK